MLISQFLFLITGYAACSIVGSWMYCMKHLYPVIGNLRALLGVFSTVYYWQVLVHDFFVAIQRCLATFYVN